MKSATENAAAIRASLKVLGISSKQVSVRSEYFSLGSAIRIEIKDAAVPMSVVKAIASPAEHVRRCEITGDILGGGNCYLTYSYSDKAQADLKAPHKAAVEAAIASLKDDHGHAEIASLPGASVSLYNGHAFSVWGEHGHLGVSYDADGVAFLLGSLAVNAA